MSYCYKVKIFKKIDCNIIFSGEDFQMVILCLHIREMNCNNMFLWSIVLLYYCLLSIIDVLLTFQRALTVTSVKICAAGVEIPTGRSTKVRENSVFNWENEQKPLASSPSVLNQKSLPNVSFVWVRCSLKGNDKLEPSPRTKLTCRSKLSWSSCFIVIQ